MPAPNRPSAQPQRLAWAFVLVFLACIGGAYAWFNSGANAHESTIRYESRSHMEGFDFRAEPISQNEQAALATTNLINGSYIGQDGKEIRVFFANWSDSDGKNLSVVQHTPDLCWVKVGWLPVSLGQPDKMTVQFGSTNLDFECRVFETPGSGVRQLVVWSTLVGGKPFQESWRFQASKTASPEGGWIEANRFLAANQFFQSLRKRTPSDRNKQFVRYSTPVQGDWQTAFETLHSFGPKWIEVKSQTP